MTGKFLGNSGLADTPCTPDKKSCRSVLILLPTQHLLIYFASENSFCHFPLCIIRCKSNHKIPNIKGKVQKMPKFSMVEYLKTPKFSKVEY